MLKNVANKKFLIQALLKKLLVTHLFFDTFETERIAVHSKSLATKHWKIKFCSRKRNTFCKKLPDLWYSGDARLSDCWCEEILFVMDELFVRAEKLNYKLVPETGQRVYSCKICTIISIFLSKEEKFKLFMQQTWYNDTDSIWIIQNQKGSNLTIFHRFRGEYLKNR